MHGRVIIANVDLTLKEGSVHALMGPNGSGKSSLALALMGHPKFDVSGSAQLDNVELLTLRPEERSKTGLFLSFQHPIALPGVSVFTFLKESYSAVHGAIEVKEFETMLYNAMDVISMEYDFAFRSVHEGFSGGEQKRLELLQLLVLKPKVAFLDEVDSGLDIDALKIIGDGLEYARKRNPALRMLIITHYQRIFNYIQPDEVHILINGTMRQSGSPSLIEQVEQSGYEAFQ